MKEVEGKSRGNEWKEGGSGGKEWREGVVGRLIGEKGLITYIILFLLFSSPSLTHLTFLIFFPPSSLLYLLISLPSSLPSPFTSNTS